MNAQARGRVIIAGGSGFLGLNVAHYLHSLGYTVTILSRGAAPVLAHIQHARWDGRTLGDWAQHVDGAVAVIHLAGRSVDCIKTPDHCDEILRSRVESTTVLGAAVRQAKNPPPVWIQMSTAHRYGDSLTAWCDEESAFGYGLAPYVGQAWEESFARAAPAGMRQVILRTSFVLGRSGGALPTLARLARWGLGGKVGSGRQGISWIHEQDMNALFAQAIRDDSMHGAYLATAPNPVSNAVFMRTLRRALGMPFGLPALGWMVRVGAPLLFRTDPDLALYGRYCVSRRLREAGFPFAFAELAPALHHLYARPAQTARPAVPLP